MPTVNATNATEPIRWIVMPDPVNKWLHPFHDRRWIATADAEVEFGHDKRSWALTSGHLICQMRDGPEEDALMVAAAPRLRDMLKRLRDAAMNTPALDSSEEWSALISEADAAIAATKGAHANR
jgi:hypothetical protein